MFVFETADQKQVQRLRIAQFNGRPATVNSDNKTVTGLVRSVLENASCVPPRWTITLVPAPAKPKPLVPRPSPRFDRLAEDHL